MATFALAFASSEFVSRARNALRVTKHDHSRRTAVSATLLLAILSCADAPTGTPVFQLYTTEVFPATAGDVTIDSIVNTVCFDYPKACTTATSPTSI